MFLQVRWQLSSPAEPAEVVRKLRDRFLSGQEEIRDRRARYRGWVYDRNFEITSASGHSFSVRARGSFQVDERGTIICIHIRPIRYFYLFIWAIGAAWLALFGVAVYNDFTSNQGPGLLLAEVILITGALVFLLVYFTMLTWLHMKIFRWRIEETAGTRVQAPDHD
jgi:hypothetical protein